MRIEIFRTGTHKPIGLEPRTYTETDLDRIVTANEGKEAPIVIGHPKLSDPAYGWAKSYGRTGDVLYADAEDIDPDFQKLLSEKKYKNVSIALNSDYTIRHIGFLGAIPPAVQGLKPVSFADSEDYIAFGEEEIEPEAEKARPFTESELEAEAQPEPEAQPETKPEPEIAPEQEDPLVLRMKAAEAKVAALEKEMAEKLAKEKKAEFAKFADEQVLAGRIKPDMKEKIVLVFESLHKDDSGTLKFSDTESEGVIEFKEIITGLPQIIKPGRIKEAQYAAEDESPKICKTASTLAEHI